MSLSPGCSSSPPSTVSSATVRRIQIDGGAPTHDLVDSGRRDAGGIGLPQRPLVGVLGQGQQPVADGVAGRLVARHDQEDEEGRHLGRGERFAVDVGVDQGGGDVVGRVDPSGLGQLGHEGGEVLRRRHEGQQRSAPSGTYSGSPWLRIMLDALKTVL